MALIIVNWEPSPNSVASSSTFSPAAPLSMSELSRPTRPTRRSANVRFVTITSKRGGDPSIAGWICLIARITRGSSTTTTSRYGTFEAVGARRAACSRRSTALESTGSGEKSRQVRRFARASASSTSRIIEGPGSPVNESGQFYNMNERSHGNA